ncbi:hypothetical protein ES705_30798 [subsurface metagenome]
MINLLTSLQDTKKKEEGDRGDRRDRWNSGKLKVCKVESLISSTLTFNFITL